MHTHGASANRLSAGSGRSGFYMTHDTRHRNTPKPLADRIGAQYRAALKTSGLRSIRDHAWPNCADLRGLDTSSPSGFRLLDQLGLMNFVG